MEKEKVSDRLMTRVLVMDAQMRNSLAIIRSLGKKGIRVIAAEDSWFATGFFSRYCSGRIIYPNPDKYPERFVDYLLSVLKKNRYTVLFPVTDKTVTIVAKYKEEFSKYTRVPVPDYAVLMNAIDKAKTLEIARQCQVPYPKTLIADGVKDLEAVKDELSFPIVIKPRKSSGSRGLALCRTPEELMSAFPRIAITYGGCLIQEFVPRGDELGVYALLNARSELRAITVQRRLRSYPVLGGPSTLRETVRKPELIEIALKLLKALKWSGVAMVEFRIDPRDNVPKLMEVNPRWWGSLQLSILSGVDFPYLLYKLATEGDVETNFNYKAGVRCRWLLPGDILWFLSTSHKFRHLPEFLRFGHDDIISPTDPGPTLGFFLASLRFAFDRDKWRLVIRNQVPK